MGMRKRPRPVLTRALFDTTETSCPRFSAFFVRLDVSVNQVRDIVIVLFFLLKEGVVASVIAQIDIVIDRCGDLVVTSVRLFEGDDFRSRFRKLGFLVIGRRSADGGAREGRRLEGCATFRTENGVPVEIEEFRAAILALPFAAEFRFCHVRNPLVVVRGSGQAVEGYIGRSGYSRGALVSIGFDQENPQR
jgi:hypothetical protein